MAQPAAPDTRVLTAQEETRQIHSRPKPKSQINYHPVEQIGRARTSQVDLLDANNLTPQQNRGKRYIVVAVDIKSRKMVTHAIRQKSDAHEAVPEILRVLRPKVVQSDGGNEFLGRFKAQLTAAGVDHQVRDQAHEKEGLSVVERRNGFLRERIGRHLTENNTSNWVDSLGQITSEINSDAHVPTDSQVASQRRKAEADVLQPDTLVRHVLAATRFEHRAGRARWSQDMFIITQRTGNMYSIRNALTGEDGPREFREYELQVVKPAGQGGALPLPRNVDSQHRVAGIRNRLARAQQQRQQRLQRIHNAAGVAPHPQPQAPRVQRDRRPADHGPVVSQARGVQRLHAQAAARRDAAQQQPRGLARLQQAAQRRSGRVRQAPDRGAFVNQ